MTGGNAIAVDSLGNVYISSAYGSYAGVRIIPAVLGNYFGANLGDPMDVGNIYSITDSTAGYAGDNGPVTSAQTLDHYTLAFDAADNLYIADMGNDIIRMVPQTTASFFGISMNANSIYTIVGTPTTPGYSGDGSSATGATLGQASGIALDALGNLYISDLDNDVIRMVPKVSGSYFGNPLLQNNIYTIAGNGSTSYSGDGGAATSASFKSVNAVALAPTGEFYVFDTQANSVRVVDTSGAITTLAGQNPLAGDGGVATLANLYSPGQIGIDSSDNIYIADISNGRVRMIPSVSGTYHGINMTAGNLYTIAGGGQNGQTDGADPLTLSIVNPRIAVDPDGNVFIASGTMIYLIPRISGTFYTKSMRGGLIYKIGGGGPGRGAYSGDGVLATTARFGSRLALAVDSSDNLYVADTMNNAIRMISSSSTNHFGNRMSEGFVYTLTSTTAGSRGDAGASTSAQLRSPAGVAVDSAGNIYISDLGNQAIRMISVATTTNFGISMSANSLYTIAGTLTSSGFSGDGAVATSSQISAPQGIAVDASGNVIFSDCGNNVIRLVAATTGSYYGVSVSANNIATIAGTPGTSGYTGDGGTATSAELTLSSGLAFDSHSNLYFSDLGNNIIREILH